MKFNPFDKTIFQSLEWYEKEELVEQIAYLIYPEDKNHP